MQYLCQQWTRQVFMLCAMSHFLVCQRGLNLSWAFFLPGLLVCIHRTNNRTKFGLLLQSSLYKILNVAVQSVQHQCQTLQQHCLFCWQLWQGPLVVLQLLQRVKSVAVLTWFPVCCCAVPKHCRSLCKDHCRLQWYLRLPCLLPADIAPFYQVWMWQPIQVCCLSSVWHNAGCDHC